MPRKGLASDFSLLVLFLFEANSKIKEAVLVELLAANGRELTLIDARSASSFKQEHIPEAISIYHADFDKKIDQLPADKDQLLVYYCNGTS